MARFDPAAAWEHIDALAAKHRITVRVVRRRSKAEAHIATRQAWAPTQRSAVDYLVTLHEMGHICSAESRRHYRRWAELERLEDEVCCEGAAWAWAMEVADKRILATMTERQWQQVGALMVSYLRWGQSHSRTGR